MGTPLENERLRQAIFFYQASQKKKSGGGTLDGLTTTWRDKFTCVTQNKPREVLSAIVQHAQSGEVMLLHFMSDQNDDAHAVLITGCSEFDNGNYRVILYDPNTVRRDPDTLLDEGRSTTMDIELSPEEERFEIDTEGGSADFGKYNRLTLVDLDDVIKLTGPASEVPDADERLRYLYIELPRGQSLYLDIQNEGRIQFDGNQFTGDTELIKDIKFTSVATEGGKGSVEIALDAGKTVEVKTPDSKEMSVDVYNNDGFVSVDGKGMDSAVLSPNNGLTINGTNYSFKAYTSTKDTISDNETGLVSVSGEAKSQVKIQNPENAKVTVSSKEPITNIQAKSYVGVDSQEEAVPSSSSDFSFNSARTINADDQQLLGNATTFRSKALYIVCIAGIIILLCIAVRRIMIRRREKM